MRIIAVLLAVAALATAQEWKTAKELPGISFEGLTADQKMAVLQVLREYNCTCGCIMTVAQCRFEDPPCGHSTGLAKMAVAAAKQGKSAAEIRTLLDSSNFAKMARDRNRILLDPVEIPIAGAPVRGPVGAKVTLVEFSDFQCPYCAVAVGKINQLMQAYPNDVRLVFKQFPLDIHSNAAQAAAAALAAHAQGKFWPLHDKMYGDWRHLSRANILAWAKDVGLDTEKLQAAMDSPATKAAIERDMDEGFQAGVQGTPTVYVNGKKYQGPLDFEVFHQIIDAELKGQ